LKLDVVYVGDAAAAMKTNIPNDSIDLTVTSPPYNEMRSYDNKGFSWEDFSNIAQELYRVTKPGGVVVWIVGDQTKDGSETLTSLKQALYFKEKCGFRVHDTMIYEKAGFSNPGNVRYHQTWEYMFILSKNKPKTFNPIKDRPNKYAGQSRRGTNFKRQKTGELVAAKQTAPYGEFGMRFNVWRYAVGKVNSTPDDIAFKHPAIFPEKLALDHILSWSNENDIVLDPMAGSGTTLKMAALNNRHFIGIERHCDYVDNILIERLSQHGIKAIVDKTLIL